MPKRRNNLQTKSPAPTAPAPPRPRPKRGGKKKKEKQPDRVLIPHIANPLVSESDMCLKNFLTVRANPFARVNGPICNPMGDSGYYSTYPFYGRYNVTIGSAGNGWLVAYPYSSFSDSTSIAYTQSGYLGSDINTVAANVAHAKLNTVATVASSLHCKLVSFGIRAYSTSPALTVKGSVYSLRFRDNVYNVTNTPETAIVNSMIIPSSALCNGRVYYSLYSGVGKEKDDQWLVASTENTNAALGYFNQGIFIAGANVGDTFMVEISGYMMIQHGSATETAYQQADPRATRAAGFINEAYSQLRDNTQTAFSSFLSRASAAVSTSLTSFAADALGKQMERSLNFRFHTDL